MIPLVLNLKGRKVCIIGGGEVALRKAQLFSNASQVIVVSENFHEGFKDINATLVRRRISASHVPEAADADIVIPATDDKALNDAIARDARARGRWVDEIDGIGDIVVPSIIKRGDLSISITTMGRSPALSKYVRLQLEKTIGEEYGPMLELQSEIRGQLKEIVESQEKREGILWKILEDERVWEHLRRGGLDAARKVALSYVPR